MSRANRVRKQVAAQPIKRAVAMTNNQQKYMDNILDNDYVICIGPAGSGKTHLASGLGSEYLLEKKVKKLILTRPIVAAEDIGYLPGEPEDKIHPYLLPLFDELNYFIDVNNMIKSKMVYIEPIAFLRGRTIKDSFIVVDEAQNCTFNQLKMIMTRLGEGSKMIINGDLDQSDLPVDRQGRSTSGLQKLVNKIRNQIDDNPDEADGVIALSKLDKTDIVRHSSVSFILEILEKESE